MKKLLDFIKKYHKQLFLIVLAMASVICLFLTCASFTRQLLSDVTGILGITGFDVFFGLKHTTTEEVFGRTYTDTIVTLYPSKLGIISLCLLFIAVVFYFFDNNKKLKKICAYIVALLLLSSAILYLLAFLYPSFAQEQHKDDYAICIYAIVGFIIQLLAFMYVLVNKLANKLIKLFKKKKQ